MGGGGVGLELFLAGRLDPETFWAFWKKVSGFWEKGSPSRVNPRRLNTFCGGVNGNQVEGSQLAVRRARALKAIRKFRRYEGEVQELAIGALVRDMAGLGSGSRAFPSPGL